MSSDTFWNSIFPWIMVILVGIIFAVYVIVSPKGKIHNTDTVNITSDVPRVSIGASNISSTSTDKDTFVRAPCHTEKFVSSGGNRAYIDSATGAYKGGPYYTDQMTHRSTEEMNQEIADKGILTNGKQVALGVAIPGEGFDVCWKSQQTIDRISSRLQPGDAQTNSELAQISKSINTATDNSTHALYTRAGSTPTKLTVNLNEVRCVIDEKYLPERDKNHQIAVVGTIIPVQGFDVRTERLGEDLVNGISLAAFSTNKRKRRTPTAAGAVWSSEEIGNMDALSQTVTTDSKGNLNITDAGGANQNTTIQMTGGESGSSGGSSSGGAESFRAPIHAAYTVGNTHTTLPK